MIRTALAALCLLLLTACASPYGNRNLALVGGVRAERVGNSSDLWNVRAAGNGFTSVERVRDFVALKSAEVALKEGGDRYEVYRYSDESRYPRQYEIVFEQGPFRWTETETRGQFRAAGSSVIRVLRPRDRAVDPRRTRSAARTWDSLAPALIGAGAPGSAALRAEAQAQVAADLDLLVRCNEASKRGGEDTLTCLSRGYSRPDLY